ncbi:MAG: hypothetical protein UU32_C0017G0003 [Candidatus Woesebacteria bacterium GW2011_GWB1_41_10]|uniref:Plasmid stabilization system n=1 Tax=Candidatus Woesebacteria bacterium GW2011_GWB1_41_10 TaxID=1618577 RepID=A0A0G0WPB6_9BACT|nr:MAG: hypothetical protein UU32_C0017G0003 [Candidatus Woesebacteria bacterium GW2011_GWB1_41_10]
MRVKKIDFSGEFEKQLKKSPLKIRVAFRNRLEIYINDKFNPILNNHALVDKFRGYRSINVTGDWRAIFREFGEGGTVYFDLIGTHSQLYR